MTSRYPSEKELSALGLGSVAEDKRYFKATGRMWGIEDDHKPFEKRGELSVCLLLFVCCCPFVAVRSFVNEVSCCCLSHSPPSPTVAVCLSFNL